jgi:hypothetical protein
MYATVDAYAGLLRLQATDVKKNMRFESCKTGNSKASCLN